MSLSDIEIIGVGKEFVHSCPVWKLNAEQAIDGVLDWRLESVINRKIKGEKPPESLEDGGHFFPIGLVTGLVKNMDCYDDIHLLSYPLKCYLQIC